MKYVGLSISNKGFVFQRNDSVLVLDFPSDDLAIEHGMWILKAQPELKQMIILALGQRPPARVVEILKRERGKK